MMMRLAGGGLACLMVLWLTATASLAQTGEVESIGFNKVYRPDCWTPLRVRIKPEQSGTYQIQVYQSDLDADLPIYTRTITLTGAAEGGGEQKFWAYFLPQPLDGGLLDASRGGSPAQLQQQLRVYLADEDGRPIVALPITTSIVNVDPSRSVANPFASPPRGNRLILAVTDGSQPAWREYERAIGLLEDLYVVAVRPEDLPGTARCYEAVDAIVWFDPPPPDSSTPTSQAIRQAIEQYVWSGGKLIIIQPPQRDATRGWGELLPVRVQEVRPQTTLDPLPDMANPRGDQGIAAQWAGLPGPFSFARAEPRAPAVSEWPIEWDGGGPPSPLIVRKLHGAGGVTWVAYDLGNPALTSRTRDGWAHVWDRVFGWRNDTRIVDNATPDEVKVPYAGGILRDIGPTAAAGIEASGKSRAYVGLAVVFFIVYWVVAGPGMYLYLAARARAHLSWLLFAVSAIVATLVTTLLVEALVRGDPELWHVSLVRQAYNEPAMVLSRFGLYIPRSGLQEIELLDSDIRGDSYISPFPIHPEYVKTNPDFPPMTEYPLEVRDPGSGERVRARIPYRSTLKKLQARWVGPLAGSIQGRGTINEAGRPTGSLTNATGRTLHNVFLCYRNLDRNQDELLYIPQWDDRVTLDLAQESDYSKAKFVAAPGETTAQSALPERRNQVQGSIHAQWVRNWYQPLRGSSFASVEPYSDAGEGYKRSIAMLSFFDRLPPAANSPQEQDRFELLRRNARHMDVSAAVAAGALVVVAEAREPLPIPLTVDGDRVGGQGTTYYQFILPMDRPAGAVAGPATAPEAAPAATRPASARPATRPVPPRPAARPVGRAPRSPGL